MAAYIRQPIEVVDGEIVVMSPPQRQHIRIAHDLFRSLDRFLEENQLGRAWLEAPYLLEADDRGDWVRGARTPDLSFIARERVEAHDAQYGDVEGPYRLAPDLAVEIVSPGDSYSTVMQKVADYLRYGVRLVWVIDPQTRAVRIHTQEDPDGRTLSDTDTLSGEPVLAGWSMSIKLLLDGKE
jgi:Uma2 family endonuclease